MVSGEIRKKINKNFEYLRSHLIVVDIYPYMLRPLTSISDESWERIKANEKIPIKAASEFLEILKKGPDKDYEKFIQVLVEIGRRDIAGKLEPELDSKMQVTPTEQTDTQVKEPFAPSTSDRAAEERTDDDNDTQIEDEDETTAKVALPPCPRASAIKERNSTNQGACASPSIDDVKPMTHVSDYSCDNMYESAVLKEHLYEKNIGATKGTITESIRPGQSGDDKQTSYQTNEFRQEPSVKSTNVEESEIKQMAVSQGQMEHHDTLSSTTESFTNNVNSANNLYINDGPSPRQPEVTPGSQQLTGQIQAGNQDVFTTPTAIAIGAINGVAHETSPTDLSLTIHDGYPVENNSYPSTGDEVESIMHQIVNFLCDLFHSG